MSDNDDAALESREDTRFTTELFLYLVQCLGKRGFVRVSDIKKLYTKATGKDKSIIFRPLPKILDECEKRLYFYFKWRVGITDEKLYFVNKLKQPPIVNEISSERNRMNGVLRAALMYIFVAKNPNAKSPLPLEEDVMQFLEKLCASNVSGKYTQDEANFMKKLIAPNNRAHFVKKGWISYHKEVNESDEEVFRYDWGPNARNSVDPTKLVELFQNFTGYTAANLKEQTARAYQQKLEIIEAIKKPSSASIKGRF